MFIIFIGILVSYVLVRKKGKIASLIDTLIMFPYVIPGSVLGIGLIVALPMWLVLALAWIVCTLLAAFKAYDGQPYRYPITIRLFK